MTVTCSECDYLYYDTVEPSYIVPQCANNGFVPFVQGGAITEHKCKYFTPKGTREKIDINDANTLELLTLYCKKQGFDVDEFIKFLKKTGEI